MKTERIKYINNKYNSKDKLFISYWMQQSMRCEYNHALDYAISMANLFKLPLLVFFILRDNYLDANYRHYKFMLEGLIEVKKTLNDKGIRFILFNSEDEAYKIIEQSHTFIMDYGYLKQQISWRKEFINYIQNFKIQTNTVIIESDLVVPVKQAYFKGAYGAYVLRPHIMKKYIDYLDYSKPEEYLLLDQKIYLNNIDEIELDLTLLEKMNLDKNVKGYYKFKGGHSEAIKHLISFFENKARNYSKRSDPSLEVQSYQSIYLHFGNISPLEINSIANEYYSNNLFSKDDYDSFIEQLIVRRELSFNFVTYEKDYDNFNYITEEWAYKTMKEHVDDKRDYIYSKEDLEFSKTHDKYFNACMDEARITGFMANYMRMYWAKKIIEWSNSYEEAYYTTVYLNNKYLLDGRDANTYTNIAWCYGKMDRPWIERPIFGKLRYMNDKGLIKKFDMDKYLKNIEELKK